MEKEITHEAAERYLNSVIKELETAYQGKRKGIFVFNDTHANVLLNLLFRKYGKLPDDYFLIGFNDSPISREAILPISTVAQQIDKIAYEAVSLLVDQMNERQKKKTGPLKRTDP